MFSLCFRRLACLCNVHVAARTCSPLKLLTTQSLLKPQLRRSTFPRVRLGSWEGCAPFVRSVVIPFSAVSVTAAAALQWKIRTIHAEEVQLSVQATKDLRLALLEQDNCPYGVSTDVCTELGLMQTNAPQHSWNDTVKALQAHRWGETTIDKDSFFSWVLSFVSPGRPWADVVISPTSDSVINNARNHCTEDGIQHPTPLLHGRIHKQAVASGAVAQVHVMEVYASEAAVPGGYSGKGKTATYAVKVRHPRVAEVVHRDLRILTALTKSLVRLVSGLEWMALPDAVQTFAATMRDQLDMRLEAVHLLMFRENFKGLETIVFPEPLVDFCTDRILIETYENGDHIYEYAGKDSRGGKGAGVMRHELAFLAFQMFIKMIFADNLIHSDLHPGNILVRRSCKGLAENESLSSNRSDTSLLKTIQAYSRMRAGGAQPQLVVLDAGLITTLLPEDRQNLIDLFIAVSEGDGRKGARLMIERAKKSDSYAHSDHNDPEVIKRQKWFEEEMHKLFERITSIPISEVDVGAALADVLDLCRRGHVRLESNFASLVASTIVVEGLSRQLDGHFNIIQEVRPLLGSDPAVMNAYMRQKFSNFQHAFRLWRSDPGVSKSIVD